MIVILLLHWDDACHIGMLDSFLYKYNIIILNPNIKPNIIDPKIKKYNIVNPKITIVICRINIINHMINIIDHRNNIINSKTIKPNIKNTTYRIMILNALL